MEQQVTPEQKSQLDKITKQASKDLAKVLVRLFTMTFFFAGVALIIGILLLPNSPGFIVLANALGGIFTLVDAIEGSETIAKKFREDEKKILKG